MIKSHTFVTCLLLCLLSFLGACNELENFFIYTEVADYECPEGYFKEPGWTWEGKHILWIGTSIPAGGGDVDSYPAYVAQKLKATIHNEAIGGSVIRAYNSKGSWVNIDWPMSQSLSQTLEEKQFLIDYFDAGLNQYGEITPSGTYGWKHLTNLAPKSLSDEDAEHIRNSSYEYLLVAKYLDSSNPAFIVHPDVIVIDHGFNDMLYKYDDTDRIALTVPKNPYDRNHFIGACNFIVQQIRNYQPNQKIIFIGHYEYARHERVYKAQLNLFDYWKDEYPSFKLWDALEWTQEIDPSTGLTITKTNMPDDLHPYTDQRINPETGYKLAIEQIGEACYGFFKDLY